MWLRAGNLLVQTPGPRCAKLKNWPTPTAYRSRCFIWDNPTPTWSLTRFLNFVGWTRDQVKFGLTHGSCAGWCARLKSGRLLPSSCWNWQARHRCRGGSVTPSQNSELLGADIRASLANGAEPSHPGERERVLDWWVGRVEDLGAIVSRYRPDGNLHWTVEPSEARGSSLCHPLAPYIVLNSKDSAAGRLFTLMHELAHLYFGQCGVDDIGDERLLPVEARLLEQRCNQVAAAILMPAGLFTSEWTSAKGDVEDKVRAIADRFGVSRQAAGVRAKSDGIGFISSEQYSAMFGYLTNEYNEFRDSRARSSGGGGMSVPVRVLKDYGSRYVQLVCDAHAEEQLSLLDTADALSVRIGDVSGIKRRLR